MAEILHEGTEVRVNMGEARTRLTDLVDMALMGTIVLLMRRNQPVVQLVAAPDYSRSRHTHPDDVSCYAAGPLGHPPRVVTEDGPSLPPTPPPPPPEERRPTKPPKPPRNREVSSVGHANGTETAKTNLQPSAAVDVKIRQRNIDSILNNLGGKKRKG